MAVLEKLAQFATAQGPRERLLRRVVYGSGAVVLVIMLALVLWLNRPQGGGGGGGGGGPSPAPEAVAGAYRVRVRAQRSDQAWETVESERPLVEISQAEGKWQARLGERQWTGTPEEMAKLRFSVPWKQLDEPFQWLDPTAVEKAELSLAFVTTDNKLKPKVEATGWVKLPDSDNTRSEAAMPGPSGPGMPAVPPSPYGSGGYGGMYGPPRAPGYRNLEAALIGESEGPPPGRVVDAREQLAPGEARRFVGHAGPLVALAVASQGAQVVGSDAEGVVRQWSLTGSESRVLQVAETRSLPGFVCPLPDGARVLSAAGLDRAAHLRLWQPSKDRGTKFELGAAPPSKEAVAGPARQAVEQHFAELVLSADGRRALAVVVCESPFVGVWDMDKPKPLWRTDLQEKNAGPVRSSNGVVALAPDGRRALAKGRIWEVDTGRPLALAGPEYLAGDLAVLAFSPDGELAAIGYRNRAILLWNTVAGKQVAACLGSECVPSALAFSPDGTRLLSAGSDGATRLWEVASGRELRRYRWSNGQAAGSLLPKPLQDRLQDSPLAARSAVRVAWVPGGRFGLSSGPDGAIHLWDLETADATTNPVPSAQLVAADPGGPGRDVCMLAERPDGKRRLQSVEVDEGGQKVAVLEVRDVESGKKLWDVPDPEEERKRLHAARCCAAAFSPKDDLLAIAAVGQATERPGPGMGLEYSEMEDGEMMGYPRRAPGKGRMTHQGPPVVWLWKVGQPSPLRRVELAFSPELMTVTADGCFLIAAGPGRVSLIQVGNLRITNEFQGIDRLLAVSGDGKFVVAEMASSSKFSKAGPEMSLPGREMMGGHRVAVIANVGTGEEVCRIGPKEVAALSGGGTASTPISEYAAAFAAGDSPGDWYVYCAARQPASAVVMLDVGTGKEVRRFEADLVRPDAAATAGKEVRPPGEADSMMGMGMMPMPGMMSSGPSMPMGKGPTSGYSMMPGMGDMPGGYGGRVRRGRPPGQGPAGPGVWTCLDVSRSARRLAAGTADGTVYVFDVDKLRRLAKVAPVLGEIRRVSFAEEKSLAVTVSPAVPPPAHDSARAMPGMMGNEPPPAELGPAMTCLVQWPDLASMERDAEAATDIKRVALRFPPEVRETQSAGDKPEWLTLAHSIPLDKSDGLPKRPAAAPPRQSAPYDPMGMPSSREPAPVAASLLPLDAKRAVSQGKDSGLHVIMLADGQPIVAFEDSKQAQAIRSDGKSVLGIVGTSELLKWEIESGKCRGRAYLVDPGSPQMHPALPSSAYSDMMLDYSPMSVKSKGGVRKGGRAPGPGGRAPALCCAVSLDWKLAAVNSGSEVRIVKLPAQFGPRATSAPGKKPAAKTVSRHVVCAELKTIQPPEQGVLATAVAWLPDNASLLIGWTDGAVTLCDAQSGRQRGVCQPHSTSIADLLVSADGAVALSVQAPSGGSIAGYLTQPAATPASAQLWEVKDGKRLAEFTVGNGPVILSPSAVLAFSADNRDLALWHARSGRNEARKLLDGAAQCLALLPDGSGLLALSDRSLSLWQLHSKLRPLAAAQPAAKPGGEGAD